MVAAEKAGVCVFVVRNGATVASLHHSTAREMDGAAANPLSPDAPEFKQAVYQRTITTSVQLLQGSICRMSQERGHAPWR